MATRRLGPHGAVTNLSLGGLFCYVITCLPSASDVRFTRRGDEPLFGRLLASSRRVTRGALRATRRGRRFAAHRLPTSRGRRHSRTHDGRAARADTFAPLPEQTTA